MNPAAALARQLAKAGVPVTLRRKGSPPQVADCTAAVLDRRPEDAVGDMAQEEITLAIGAAALGAWPAPPRAGGDPDELRHDGRWGTVTAVRPHHYRGVAVRYDLTVVFA